MPLQAGYSIWTQYETSDNRVFHKHAESTKMTILASQALLHEKKIQQQMLPH